jgi:hypothetical protein
VNPLHSVCWQTVPSEHEHDQKSEPPGSATTVHLRIEALSESLAVGEAAEFYLVAIEGRHTGRWIQLGAAPVTAARDPQLEIVLPDSDVVQLVRGAIVAGTSECERLYAEDPLRVRVRIRRVVTNILRHAYRDDREHDITVSIDFFRFGNRYSVRGRRRTLRSLETPACRTADSILDVQIGGRGLTLLRAAASHLEYRSDGGSPQPSHGDGRRE